MQEGKLGKNQDVFITDSLDTWDNDVRGSSARVFLGTYRHSNGFRRMAAFKFMRPPETEDFDTIEYGKDMFIEEVAILHQLQDVPGVMCMIESGFVKFENLNELPPDTSPGTARRLRGKLIRLAPEETDLYLNQYETNIENGWLPYLLLSRSRQENNLLLACDKHRNRGRYFPLEKALSCAIQACDILHIAHERNIIYRDHKIVHYYWDDERRKLTMIDWNVAKRYPQGLSQHDIQHDLTLFASRALHYMLAGRVAPGALKHTSKTEEVEQAADAYQVNWNDEDRKHLSADIRNVLTKALAGQYDSAQTLGKDLKAFQKLSLQ